MASASEGLIQKKRSFGQRLLAFLEANQSFYDVTFSVGPQKRKVKTLSILIKAASPKINALFEDRWQFGVVRGDEGIPLPDMDPDAFSIFLRLIILDSCSEEIQRMNLPPKIIFNLVSITRTFEMREMENELEIITEKYTLDFANFSKTPDFLSLSRENLKDLLSRDKLALDEVAVFKSAYSWAENYCRINTLSENEDNLRTALGSALYHIRFPTMTMQDFAKNVCTTNILTKEEQIQIFIYISTSEKKKNEIPFSSGFVFNPKRRDYTVSVSKENMSVRKATLDSLNLHFLNGLEIINQPPFICDGTRSTLINLNVSSKIFLERVGFLGPVDADAEYDVTVEVGRAGRNQYSSIQKIGSKIVARKGTVFHVDFEPPIALTAYADQHHSRFNHSNGHYWIDFSLKGPNCQTSKPVKPGSTELRSEIGGIAVFSRHRSNQLADIVLRCK